MTTEPKHTPMPSLCESCRQHVEREVAQAPGLPASIKGCRHAHPGRVVVAIAHVRGGRIEAWSLEGPIPEDAAEQIALAFVAAYQASAVKPPPGATRQ